MPAAEVDVSVELVRQLLAEQHPDLAGLPLAVLANGWDNMVCTVGEDLLARLPRRAQAAELVAHEQRWLPLLAPGRGWALSLALVFLMHSADNPLIAGIGKHTFREVLR